MGAPLEARLSELPTLPMNERRLTIVSDGQLARSAGPCAHVLPYLRAGEPEVVDNAINHLEGAFWHEFSQLLKRPTRSNVVARSDELHGYLAVRESSPQR